MYMRFLAGCFTIVLAFSACSQEITFHDVNRDREISITITLPTKQKYCSNKSKCKVAFISAGYGVPYTKYHFITKVLNENGILSIAINHELQNDPPLSKTGDLYNTRIENWKRGAETIYFIKNKLLPLFTNYDFNKLILIGHSNGGDISTWLSNENTDYISQLITLDNMRVTLPKTHNINVLSIRASEYVPNKNILPTQSEQSEFNSCVITIPHSKHMDLTDFGTDMVKSKAVKAIIDFLKNQECAYIKNNIYNVPKGR